MVKAFVSHASPDSTVAHEFTDLLKRTGFDVWSTENVSPGTPFHAALEQAIEDSDVFFVLMTKNSVGSENVSAETAIALAERQKGGARVVPVRLQDVSAPFFLRSVQWLDFSDTDPDEEARELAKLHEAIGRSSDVELDEELQARRRFLEASRANLDMEMARYSETRAIFARGIAVATATVSILAAVAGFASSSIISDFQSARVGLAWMAVIGLLMFLAGVVSGTYFNRSRRLASSDANER